MTNAASDSATVPTTASTVSGAVVNYELAWLLPELSTKVKCPCALCGGRTADVLSLVQHLNDGMGWSRESIADWLETLDVDLTFPTVPPPKPERTYITASKLIVDNIQFKPIDGSAPGLVEYVNYGSCEFVIDKKWLEAAHAAFSSMWLDCSTFSISVGKCAGKVKFLNTVDEPHSTSSLDLPEWASIPYDHVPTTPELPAWDKERHTATSLPPEPEEYGVWSPQARHVSVDVHDPTSYTKLKERRRGRNYA